MVDFDGRFLIFHQGDYFNGMLETMKRRYLINNWSPQNKINFATFSLMKNIRYESIVTYENFYDESGQPRIILSWVDGSLSAWLKRDGYKNCFKTAVQMTESCSSKRLRRIIM